MTTKSLLINYSIPQPSPSDSFVLLEQEEWGPNVGMLTKAGAIAYLDALLFGDPEEDLEENCGVATDDLIKTYVYAYPYPANLAFDIHITHGTLTSQTFQQEVYSEIINVQQDTELDLKYPAVSIISAEWVANAYDANFNKLSGVPLTISGNKVLVGQKVFGSVLVKYNVVRYRYRASVPLREDDTDEGYNSYIYTIWDGGNNVIKFEPSEDATLEGSNCGNRFGELTVGDDGDDRVPPYADGEDIIKYRDYCQDCILRYVGFEIRNGVGTHVWECDE